MKIKITIEEITRLIQSTYNLPADTKVVIVRKTSTPYEVTKLIEDITALNFQNQKIPAIKRFRELVPSGLAEAKWAVENWPTVTAWLKTNKRIPKFMGGWDNLRLV